MYDFLGQNFGNTSNIHTTYMDSSAPTNENLDVNGININPICPMNLSIIEVQTSFCVLNVEM